MLERGANATDAATPLVLGLAFLAIGIALYRSVRPAYHVMLV